MGLNDWNKVLKSAGGKECVNRKIAPEVVNYADGYVGTE